jgi:hypothetical protein
MMGTLMQLAMAAIGMGGWMHGGFTPLVVMGGTPVCKGLGCKPLRGQGEQQSIAWASLADHLATCVLQA